MLQNNIRKYGRGGRCYNYIADTAHTMNRQTDRSDKPYRYSRASGKEKSLIPILENPLEGESISASNISELALAKLEMLALEKLRLGFGLTGGDIGLKGAMKGVSDR